MNFIRKWFCKEFEYVEEQKNISEPIFAMISTWKENPKRFTMTPNTTTMSLFSGDHYSYHRNPSYNLTITDSVSGEQFEFGLYLECDAYKDVYNGCHFIFRHFATHKVYPILGSRVSGKLAWMTQEELDYIIETVKPYYLKRVNRYRDIVESRLDRTRKASELKSEIAKQKERDRLTGVYK